MSRQINMNPAKPVLTKVHGRKNRDEFEWANVKWCHIRDAIQFREGILSIPTCDYEITTTASASCLEYGLVQRSNGNIVRWFSTDTYIRMRKWAFECAGVEYIEL